MQSSARRGRTLIEADRHSLEFTSGQLIIAICGLLLLWLAGFLMGVVAGRFDKVAQLTDKASTAVATATEEVRSRAENADQPREVPTRQATQGAPSQKKVVRAPAPKSANTATKYIQDHPSSAATRTSPTVATAPPAAQPKPEPAPAPAAVQTPAPAPAPAPATPQAVAAAAPPELSSLPSIDLPPDKPSAEKQPDKVPAAAPASSGKGNFTIQLISYKATNKKLAESYVQQLKKDGLNVDLVQSKDKRFYQVLYGSFGDRAAADKARADLIKKKADLSECRVREK